MADNDAVMLSLGTVEGWIEKVAESEKLDATSVLIHLKIVEQGFREYSRNISYYRNLVRELKGKIDAAATL
jgi:hypothetical protein